LVPLLLAINYANNADGGVTLEHIAHTHTHKKKAAVNTFVTWNENHAHWRQPAIK